MTVLSSSPERVDQAVKRLDNANVNGAVLDVRNESAAVEVLQSLAPVDHIVFSGVDIIIRGKLEELNLDDAKHLFGVKFWGAVVIGKGTFMLLNISKTPDERMLIVSAVLKYDIIKSGGSLTLTSGMAAVNPGKGAAVGGALNGGVLSLTTGLASDLAEKKIRVNTVVPGLVKTELWDKLGKSAEQQESEFKAAAEKMPVGFVATPIHIAESYLYLVRADYATGTLVRIGMSNALSRSLKNPG